MHIGEYIRRKLKEQGHTITWLANEYGCTRANIYKLLDKPTMDTGTLFRFSLILCFDFFKLYTEELERRRDLSVNE